MPVELISTPTGQQFTKRKRIKFEKSAERPTDRKSFVIGRIDLQHIGSKARSADVVTHVYAIPPGPSPGSIRIQYLWGKTNYTKHRA